MDITTVDIDLNKQTIFSRPPPWTWTLQFPIPFFSPLHAIAIYEQLS